MASRKGVVQSKATADEDDALPVQPKLPESLAQLLRRDFESANSGGKVRSRSM